jgi:hypothetical protein
MKYNIISLLQRIEEERLRRALRNIKTEDAEVIAIRKALHSAGLLTIR